MPGPNLSAMVLQIGLQQILARRLRQRTAGNPAAGNPLTTAESEPAQGFPFSALMNNPLLNLVGLARALRGIPFRQTRPRGVRNMSAARRRR